MTTVRDIVTEWMGDTKEELINSYDRQGLRASGSYARSLEEVITERPNGFNLKMKAAKHAYWMENGRGPNAVKSPEEAKRLYPIISQWVQDKRLGFDKGHIFAICLKIVYSGIRVPNKYNPGGVVSDVVTEKRIDDLINKIGRNILGDFQSTVIKTLKDG